jgi:hypothetical protein
MGERVEKVETVKTANWDGTVVTVALVEMEALAASEDKVETVA